MPVAAMVGSPRKQAWVWQKKGATVNPPELSTKQATTHKVGLARQLQLIAEQSCKKTINDTACLDLALEADPSMAPPTETKGISDALADSYT